MVAAPMDKSVRDRHIAVYVIRVGERYINRSDGYQLVESVRHAERFTDKERAMKVARRHGKGDERGRVVRLRLKPHRMCPICQGYGRTPPESKRACPMCRGRGRIV